MFTEKHKSETRYLDGVHELGLIMVIKVPDDAAALFEKRATEVLRGGVVVGCQKRSESGREEVDTNDA